MERRFFWKIRRDSISILYLKSPGLSETLSYDIGTRQSFNGVLGEEGHNPYVIIF